MTALIWCCPRPVSVAPSPPVVAGERAGTPHAIVAGWASAGASVGALFGGTLGMLLLLVTGLWIVAPIGLVVGAVIGGIIGLIVGTLDGVVLAALARTAWLAGSEVTRLRRTRCAASTTTGAAVIVLGGGLFSSEAVESAAALFVYLPAVVGIAGAFVLSRRLPPGRPSQQPTS